MSQLSERIEAFKSVVQDRLKQILQDVADLRAEGDELRAKADEGALTGEDSAALAEVNGLIAGIDPTKDAVLPTTSETQSIRARKGKDRVGSVAAANAAAEEEGKKDKESGAKGH